MRRFVSPLSVACVLMSVSAFADRAAAESRSVFVARHGPVRQPDGVRGLGEATHLGRYSEAGAVSFTPTSDPAVLHVEGSIVYTAANGDELRASVSGELNAATGEVVATVSYVGGTGRFVAATGSSRLSGQLGPGGAISVTVSGSIDY